MNKIREGRGISEVLFPSLELLVNGGAYVSYDQPFYLVVKYYYETFISGGAYEEPDSPEFLELHSVKVKYPIYLSNDNGVTMSVDNRCELLEVFSDEQIRQVEDGLRKLAVEHVPFKYLAQEYFDDVEAQQKLGFNLK